MSTMEPDEGAQSDDQADAPRWEKTEAANPSAAPRSDELDTSDPDAGTDTS
jgi:hypothetical protein